MRFIIFTSLTSLILIFIAVRIYFWIKRKFKEQISTTHEIIKNGVGDFLTEFNRGSVLFLAENMRDRFCSQLSSCLDAKVKADTIINNLDDRIEIERKSLEYIVSEYKKIKKEFEKFKTKAMKNGDFESYNKIIEFESDIDEEYHEMANMRPFIHFKVLAKHIENKTFALPE